MFDFIPEIANVTSVRPVTATETLYHIRLPNRPLGHLPGQFVQVSLPGIGEAPISIASAPGRDGFDLCVRHVGNVTEALRRLRAGDCVGIRGPFGRGVPLDEVMGRNVLIIAGGLGLAPLRSLIQYILYFRAKFKKAAVLVGARSPDALLFSKEYKAWRQDGDIDVRVTVDVAKAGWKGDVGVITDLIPHVPLPPADTVSIVCGPPVMYHYVLRTLSRLHQPQDHIFLSLERRMKCGTGKCGHCQINGLYVCREGPVFRYDRIVHVPEAVS
ncbi:FAD/NAD(P)-binding protein [bacterium]|nr:FAD/NAD(P)-binding protein [bacterium]